MHLIYLATNVVEARRLQRQALYRQQVNKSPLSLHPLREELLHVIFLQLPDIDMTFHP